MSKVLLSKSLKTIQAIALLAMAWQVQGAAIVLQESRADQQFGCVELVENRFELSFIHSVSLTQVFDAYQVLAIDSGFKILQTQERFSAHGQGLPSLVDEPDAVAFEHSDGQFVLKLKRDIGQLIVRTDKRFKNRLYTGGQQVDLNQWPDTSISIELHKACPRTLNKLVKSSS